MEFEISITLKNVSYEPDSDEWRKDETLLNFIELMKDGADITVNEKKGRKGYNARYGSNVYINLIAKPIKKPKHAGGRHKILTPEQENEIKDLMKSENHPSVISIAKEYGVSRHKIYRLINEN